MKPALALQIERPTDRVTTRRGGTVSSETQKPRDPTLRLQHRLVRILSLPHLAIPAILFSAVVLAWTWMVRLPAAQKPLPRLSSGNRPVKGAVPAISADTLQELVRTADSRMARLVQGREEVRSMLVEFEREAARLGWKVEWSPKPLIPKYSGFSKITAIPMVAQLESAVPGKPARFSALLEWLRFVPSHPKCAEITRLSMEQDPSGLSMWLVELQFLSTPLHEEAASK